MVSSKMTGKGDPTVTLQIGYIGSKGMRGYQKCLRLDRFEYVLLYLLTGGKIPKRVHQKMLEVPIYVRDIWREIQHTGTDDFGRDL